MRALSFGVRKLVSQENQSMIERPDVPRSKFSGGWCYKTTFNAGELIPFLCEEILPGDHIKYNITPYVRMATPLFPLFSNQQVDIFIFYCANRLVWVNWQSFMGEMNDASGVDPETLVIPTFQVGDGDNVVNSIFDYFNIPGAGQIQAAPKFVEINSLPFRMYNLIYNEWFRDQNLINKVTVTTDDSADSPADFTVLNRAKAHDYFTTALPWPQKFTAPPVPLGGQAPVLGIGFNSTVAPTAGPINQQESDGGVGTYANYIDPTVVNQHIAIRTAGSGAPTFPAIFADLTQATGVTINELRQSFLIQQLLERDARGGTRYTEILKSHFGVTSPDARLQRPEYIGGGTSPLAITPIAQTAPSAITGSVGALGAAGTAMGTHNAEYASTEHGFIIGIINVRSELAYQQGLHKMWSRRSRYDYYWPSLAGLGEQAVLRQEIYCKGSDGTQPSKDANDEIVFGYQERWHEYRTRTSEITGYFRSTVASGVIDQWHLAQEFGAAPVLGQDFIEDNPPMSRVLAAGGASAGVEYLADIYIHREAVRPLPMFGTPVTLGRF